MAFQTRTRDPLFDSDTQAIIERRGKEILGLLLLGIGVAIVLALGSYSPEEPSWQSTAGTSDENLLGPIGATFALLVYVIIGYGGWAIALVPLAWGLRFLLHFGGKTALRRLIFAPVAIAMVSIYFATHVTGADWKYASGLGGHFGDVVLGAVLAFLPVELDIGLKVLSAALFVGSVALLAYVLGVTRSEVRNFARFLVSGLAFGGRTVVRFTVESVAGGWRAGLRAFRTRSSEADSDQGLRDDKSRLGAEIARPGSHSADGSAALEEPPLSREIGRIGARIADVVERRTQDSGYILREEPPLRRSESPGDLEFPRQKHSDIDEELSMPDSELMDPIGMATGSDRIAAPEATATVQHAAKRPARSRRARAEAEPFLPFSDRKTEFEMPPLGLLTDPITIRRHHLSDDALKENARMLENVLDDYGVRGEIVSVRPGPVVTMYELEPAPGLKASRVMGLADDIARSMSALSARVSTVPGRSVIGIELPNDNREMVVLREMLSTRDYGDSKQRLPLALGKNIGGDPVVADLARMPHLLIAGTTGSGKSVAINTMILSLLYKLTPEECRLIMIDPKMLELSVYDGIPHLLSPVVTDPKKAVIALKWIVGEMEERYRKMSKMGVRNIEGYNGRVKAALSKGEMFSRTVQTGFDDETGDPVFETEEFEPETLPYVVVIVDEMADLMMVAGKEIEACIQRLAQMARASGIHLIMATQRPSVDVITGTIKANFPTRVSFQVTSKVDSRTILGEMGAEQLLGQGDMLYMAGGGKIIRVHGPFVSDEEVEEVVSHLKSFGAPEYLAGVVAGSDDEASSDIDLVLGLGGNTDGEDALYDQAVQIVISDRKCSTSYIQRKLAIGYNKAARLVEQMEESGLVSAANHVGKREILVPEPG